MQAFLYFDFFVIGLMAAAAWRYAQAHFWPEKHDLGEKRPKIEEPKLSRDVKEQLLAEAQTKLRKSLDLSASKFSQDLDNNQSELIKNFQKISDQVVQEELDKYKVAIGKLEQQTEEVTENAKSDLSKKQIDMNAKLTEEIKAEKQHLIEQIDSKLADAVLSFLLDSLGHNVDLGSQASYITSVLEEHKEELKKGINDEAPASQ